MLACMSALDFKVTNLCLWQEISIVELVALGIKYDIP